MQHYDPTWYFWERLTKAAEAHAEAADRSATVREKALDLGHEALNLAKRIAVAALLWGSAGGVMLSKDQLADLIAVLLKAGR